MEPILWERSAEEQASKVIYSKCRIRKKKKDKVKVSGQWVYNSYLPQC